MNKFHLNKIYLLPIWVTCINSCGGSNCIEYDSKIESFLHFYSHSLPSFPTLSTWASHLLRHLTAADLTMRQPAPFIQLLCIPIAETLIVPCPSYDEFHTVFNLLDAVLGLAVITTVAATAITVRRTQL